MVVLFALWGEKNLLLPWRLRPNRYQSAFGLQTCITLVLAYLRAKLATLSPPGRRIPGYPKVRIC